MLYEFEFEEDYDIGDDPDDDLEKLLAEYSKFNSSYDVELVKKAFYLCYEIHSSVKRISGKPYYLHPIKVCLILILEMGIYDQTIFIAALLHDVIEDVKGPDREAARNELRLRINDMFGPEILEMVESLTKIKHSEMNATREKASTHRKLFLALIKDVRVILIKLADRLHNMRTLHYLRDKKQQEIAFETLNFYTPIAHRLGLSKVKMELEDRSLYFTDRSTYEAIKTALAQKRRDFIEYIRVFSENIQQNLNAENVRHILTIVHKHIYEIYQMIQRGQTIDEIDNFYSMVITVLSNDKFECYKAHGILVNAFNPVEQLVDYISQPKINWYQSLNTHLFGPDGKLVEVIIRTEEMDRIAEGGIASNYSISHGRMKALEISDPEIEAWGQWMEDIIVEKGDDALRLIWDSIRNNIFDSEIRAYTDEGYPVKLPNRACPIDFAFAISDDLGLHIVTAKINGQLRSLNYEIQSGDRVKIISSSGSEPKPEWQYFVISNKAEVALYNYFKLNPPKRKKIDGERTNFDIKLRIRGEDKPGILHEITRVIEKANIKRISLDTSDVSFGGILTITVTDNKHLNSMYSKLLSIKGIKSVEQIEDSE